MSIVVTCIFGATIGAIVSLEIAELFDFGQYVWILGALLGGASAYVTVDPQHFYRGVKRAWKGVIGFRITQESIIAHLVYTGGVLIFCLSVGVVALFVFILGAYSESVFNGSVLSLQECLQAGLVTAICVMTFFALLAVWLYVGIASQNSLVRNEELKDAGMFGICKLNLIFWIGLSIFSIFLLLRICIRSVPFVPRLIVHTIVAVHSERRTICFMDATMGASLGYFIGSPIIGGIAGGAFGYLSYLALRNIVKET